MKFIHLSDLHLGKRVNEFSMIEDQRYILEQILDIIREEEPDGVLLAGDIYDKSMPSAEAVQLFDEFLAALSGLELQVFIISGNHDSPERIAFGGRIMEKSGIHLSPVYDGQLKKVELTDEYGVVEIYLLPFIKPAHVRRFFPEAEIESYTDAIDTALKAALDELEFTEQTKMPRRILVTHQFVAGGERSESEELSIGGSDQVDASVFTPFDYVALGHLHGPQKVGREIIRYCGTPLKYSFSEVQHQKSVTVVELREKGELQIRTIPLKPKHDMCKLRGTYDELVSRQFYEKMQTMDYLHITLTDEEDIPDAVRKLQVIYPNLMKLEYDNMRTRSQSQVYLTEETVKKSPMEYYETLYEKQNNQPMTLQQQEYLQSLMEQIWEEQV